MRRLVDRYRSSVDVDVRRHIDDLKKLEKGRLQFRDGQGRSNARPAGAVRERREALNAILIKLDQLDATLSALMQERQLGVEDA